MGQFRRSGSLLCLLTAVSLAAPAADPVPKGKAPPRPALSEKCRQLVTYRDGALVRDWDRAAKDFSRASDSLELLRQLRDELKPYAKYSDTMQALGAMAHATKTTANLITNILRMNPGADRTVGTMIDAADQRLKNTQFGVKVNKAIEAEGKPQQIQKLMLDETVSVVTKIVGKKAPVIGPALKALYQFESDVREMNAFARGSAGLTRELEKRLANLESKLKALDKELVAARSKLNLVNETKTAIDKKCNVPRSSRRLT